ncbi:hypothetical protein [Microbacterium dextranolyticum]|uniref:Integrase catalytic domain-containing protein n=1 Tax=Microbacterium dextranolyticum TaxID=36806 RepID=A0A9W6HN97_9MICO|nr:hypothetical protein [Microbacterium dextranolyticum]MBM7462576.1 transposase InsO family protein [Microbacterium dextranolyticum]GLJ96322.1 hypothetical protein GCM10017591_23850 [Microbacterium dextranolyticum]
MALDMAAWGAGDDLSGLTHHSDHGSNYMAMVYTDQIVEQVELATLEWVWWWNNPRLHCELDMRTPIEVEAAYYAHQESGQQAPAGQGSRCHLAGHR